MSRDVNVGDRLADLVKEPITRTQLVRYAGASGDFNPIHHDEPFAQAAGYKSVIAHGMLSMGFLGQYVAAWAGSPARVRALSVRFKAITWPGDVVTCKGEVTAVRSEGGRRLVDLKVWTETSAVTGEGTATVDVS